MSLNIKNGKVKCVGYNRAERHFTVGKVYDVVDNTIVNDNGFRYKGGVGLIDSVVEWLSKWYKFEVVPTEKIIITHDYKTTTATLYRGDEKVVATARCAPEDKFDFMVGAKLAMERLVEKTSEVILNGFKVGDRVNINGHNGTVICINNLNCIGVEYDTYTPSFSHSCNGNKLLSGKTGTFGKCAWFSVYNEAVKHGEVPEYYNGKVVCIKGDTDHWTVGKVYEVKDGIVRCNHGWVHPRFDETPYRDKADIRHIGCEPWEDRRHNPRNEFVPLIED